MKDCLVSFGFHSIPITSFHTEINFYPLSLLLRLINCKLFLFPPLPILYSPYATCEMLTSLELKYPALLGFFVATDPLWTTPLPLVCTHKSSLPKSSYLPRFFLSYLLFNFLSVLAYNANVCKLVNGLLLLGSFPLCCHMFIFHSLLGVTAELFGFILLCSVSLPSLKPFIINCDYLSTLAGLGWLYSPHP